MNKSELVSAVATAASLDRKSAEKAVDALFREVMEQVGAGEKVTVVGFGSFSPSERAARTARNPRTGEAVEVPASSRVRFSPGTAFKERLGSGRQASRA